MFQRGVNSIRLMEPQSANETSAGNLGLGTALAVAYDLTEDPNFAQPNCTHLETTNMPVATVAPQSGVIVFSKSSYYPTFTAQSQPIRHPSCDPHWGASGCSQLPQQHQYNPITSTTALPMTAYLNPIPVSSPTNSSRCQENGSFYIQYVLHSPLALSSLNDTIAQSTTDLNSHVDGGLASESTMSTDSMLSVHSDTISTYPSTSEIGYTIPNTSHHVGVGFTNSINASTPSSRRHDDQRQAAVPSAGSDDGLYELSEEDVKEIDDTLIQNPQVTSSRHWKYYIETNEWTRATCALMACLFSRDQMANSTVLGRGGSQRKRLPTNLVAYVVTKMRHRFNKSAAAVRARMAQKCKDERRFGRVLPCGAVVMASDGLHPSPFSSSSSSSSSANTISKYSKQCKTSRRRSAAYAVTGAPMTMSSRFSSGLQPSPAVTPQLSAVVPMQLSQTSNEAFALPSDINSIPFATPAVPDPPVILASAPEMAR